MKEKTLLILAGGMGSRFGGLKQITPLGPSGEFIIDYSVYDALKAGFTKIVFLIKEDIYETFKETIGKRVEKHIKVEYSFQNNDNVPSQYKIPKERVKPLGTAHAILCCKDEIKEPFAIINADDFYGQEAFKQAADFLDEMNKSKENKYGLISYLVKNTLTENGAVKRGVCREENGNLTKLIESSIERKNGKLIASPLSGSEPFEIDGNEEVSMNFLLFSPSIFSYIEKKFPEFLENHKDDLSTCEYLIPDVLFEATKDNYAKTKVIKTNSKWYGVTYREDAEYVKKALQELVDKNIYPKKLWKN